MCGLISAVYLSGFGITWETYLWEYLGGCFQKDLTEDERHNQNMSSATYLAGVLGWVKMDMCPQALFSVLWAPQMWKSHCCH